MLVVVRSSKVVISRAWLEAVNADRSYEPVLLRPAGSQWGKARHEEMQPGEGDHVDCELPQVRVELAGEPQAGGHAGHGQGHQVVQVTIGWVRQLQGPRKINYQKPQWQPSKDLVKERFSNKVHNL